MKKTQLSTFLFSISLISLVGVNVATANAAESQSGKTKSDAEFQSGKTAPGTEFPEEGPKEPELFKPDEKTPPTINSVYVTHLPNISFGKNEVSITSTEYNALLEQREMLDSDTKIYLPHVVGVADVSGNAKSTWKVSVQQEKPFESESGAKLTNSRIRIYGNTLTNSGYSSADIVDKISGVNKTGDHAVIPVKTPTEGATEGELVVLQNPTEGYALNTYSTSIFMDNYKKEDFVAGKTTADQRYDGVRLNVPSSDKSQSVKYNADLVWTLTVEP